MKKCNIGFITTMSGRWPEELPLKRMEEYGQWLSQNVQANIIQLEEPVKNMQQVQQAVKVFRQNEVDLIVMVYGAFTGDDIPCALADALCVPLVLWAPHEPPFSRDDRLYANALVALTMNSAALAKMEKKCHAVYGDKENVAIAAKVKGLVRAYNTIKSMKGGFLGLFGYRPTAFYNCAFDEGLIYRTFGIRMEETDLKVIFDRMEQLPFTEVEADMKAIGARYDPSALPEKHLENHSRLYLAIKQVFGEVGYDYATLKCWPEMGALHTTPCAVLGRLADENINIACEGDVDAALAMIMENTLTNKPVFVTDMIDMNEEANTLTYWHCGNPAPSLFDVADGVSINNHPLAGQGTAFYGVLKEGNVTIARLCNIGGAYKLFLLRGKAVQSKRRTKGAMVDVKVQKPVREVFDCIINSGVAHHYSIVWEDIADDLVMVAKILGIEVIEP